MKRALITGITGQDGAYLDVSRLNSLRWHAKISLEEGISHTYNWYLSYMQPDQYEQFLS